jgi:uncharacterized protein
MASDAQKPWYHEGLRFTCTQCGKCCTGAPGYVWVSQEELEAIADYLQMPVAQLIALHSHDTYRGKSLREKANGDCIFYDAAAGCTIYPVRPAQCRTWPFWESNLHSEAHWKHTCEICPGSGTGELVPVEEITRRLKVIKL